MYVCVYVSISILIVTYSFKNKNQRAKGVIETQKWANNNENSIDGLA